MAFLNCICVFARWFAKSHIFTRFRKAHDRVHRSGRAAVNFAFYDEMEKNFGQDARVTREVRPLILVH
jgi:hypothetical protein